MFKWKQTSGSTLRRAFGGGVICMLLGVAMLHLANEVLLLSYDLLFLFKGKKSTDELVIIYMDDKSLKDLKQRSVPEWDPYEHARLLDRLTDDGARLVVFDVLFTSPASDAAKTRFADAIRRNTNVVVAAQLDQMQRPQIQAKGPVLPWFELIDANVHHGIAAVRSPPGTIARQYHPGTEGEPSLPWKAAQLMGAMITKEPDARPEDLWLNYYGPSLTLRNMSYADVPDHPLGFFRDKFVFIGALPNTLKPYEEADLFRTPYSLLRGAFFPGVEIGATAFLNFLHQDGLKLMSWPRQTLIISVAGLLLGVGMSFLRPWPAGWVSLLAVVACLAGAVVLARQHVWFGWSIVAFVQIPCALAWAIGGRVVRLKFEKDVLARTLEETTKLVEATKATAHQRPAQLIPDHTMLRRVGKGAYGEVWLARNAIGAYHAVKIVRRQGFPADEPYEREFRGIQKFMPISRSHPGFVNILHVGRDDEQRHFFCIMEAGDDKTTGQKIDPETYIPKTLATELDWRGKLTPEETLRLGLALADALEHLHQSQLIHRDIKPANIIYVNGAPKFADIGLVTDIRSADKNVSFLGTEGYIAPEGPGTASADVYALGKVLYEAAMGRDRRMFPEVPTAVFEQSSDSLIRLLNEIINRACEVAANERYQTAAELRSDLLKIQPK